MRNWLRTARIEKGYTNRELAKKLGISESYYSLIEAGTRQKRMDITLVTRLSAALGMELPRIIREEEVNSEDEGR
jgi:transcriptional regulator with XRE-family HTH domain